jgi:hypothetical protein
MPLGFLGKKTKHGGFTGTRARVPEGGFIQATRPLNAGVKASGRTGTVSPCPPGQTWVPGHCAGGQPNQRREAGGYTGNTDFCMDWWTDCSADCAEQVFDTAEERAACRGFCDKGLNDCLTS